MFVEKLYRTRSPRALLRSWPADEVSTLKPWPQADRPPDKLTFSPSAYLQRQPAALAGTGRHQLPQFGQRRRGPRHSHCATNQPPGSPTSAGHRLVPGIQAHSGMVPGSGRKGTKRQREKKTEVWVIEHTERNRTKTDSVEEERQEGNVQRNREKTGD